MRHHPLRHAFSLVELSIVLVILGLLVGGVLSGQSLIHTAELRTVITDEMKYYTAVKSFRDKYFALPGDMPNATAFWGASATLATCATTPTTGTLTCDGNGNNRIDSNGSTYYDLYYFWQHLANAGLIEGNFTGITTTSPATTKFPQARLAKAQWMAQWTGSIAPNSDATFFGGNYGNPMYIDVAGAPTVKVMTPEDAWNIDTKLDDGRANQGIVMPIKPPGSCTTAVGTSDNGDYNLTVTSKDCKLMFLNTL